MWYSILIAGLLVVCLVIYFILSKKLKMPTVATEIMTTKYNKKIARLERFCKANSLKFDSEKYLTKIADSELTGEKLIENIETIKNIASNFEEIEDIYVSSKKEEAQDKISRLKILAPLKIFAGELDGNNEISDIFETFNVGFTKLNFEFQKYLGSQQFVATGQQKMLFLNENQVVVVNENNIFETKLCECKIEILCETSKNSQDSSGGGDIFTLKVKVGMTELFCKNVFVDSSKIKKYLKNSKFFVKK